MAGKTRKLVLAALAALCAVCAVLFAVCTVYAGTEPPFEMSAEGDAIGEIGQSYSAEDSYVYTARVRFTEGQAAGIAIVVSGAQGAGKTTLVRALCNEMDPWESVATMFSHRTLSYVSREECPSTYTSIEAALPMCPPLPFPPPRICYDYRIHSRCPAAREWVDSVFPHGTRPTDG